MTPRLCAIAALLLCACAAERVIYEDDGPDGNLTAVIDPETDDAAADDAAGASGQLQCPALPQGRPLMPGLTAGWAADQGGATLLQFSSHALSCGAPIDDVFAQAQTCPDLWAFEISVDDAQLVPGDLVLTADQRATLVQFQRADAGTGCARDTIHSSSLGFGGILRIHAIDDDCIVGEFIDLTFPTEDLTGLSGVFAAERC